MNLRDLSEQKKKDGLRRTKAGVSYVERRRESGAGVSESWVRPDGSIEHNVRMDIVVSASKKQPVSAS